MEPVRRGARAREESEEAAREEEAGAADRHKCTGLAGGRAAARRSHEGGAETMKTATVTAAIKVVLSDIREVQGDLSWLCAGRESTAARIKRLYDHLVTLESKLRPPRAGKRVR